MIVIEYFCLILLLASLFMGLYRLIRGPDILTRILSFDLISICIIGIMILFSLLTDTYHYIEITLIFCLLGFVTTVAFMDTLFRKPEEEE
ncbi:MAG: K+/H+ antiporter subunit F [Chlamydiia bacterium]|nr:K+/H+ antiporter subunit F [Chlamydiia bacterium]